MGIKTTGLVDSFVFNFNLFAKGEIDADEMLEHIALLSDAALRSKAMPLAERVAFRKAMRGERRAILANKLGFAVIATPDGNLIDWAGATDYDAAE